jgi:molybdopterin converting factor small subunit
MTIQIEFFGIPRARAHVSQLELKAETLGEALAQVGVLIPQWADACLDGPRLKPGLIANLNGQKFVSDPQTLLKSGDSVLILSADVGG